MAWLLIIVSGVIVWVASLCKIYQASCSPSKGTFLSNAGGVLRKRNILLVIAHPDDESMYDCNLKSFSKTHNSCMLADIARFFTPTINYLISRGHNIHILCMSTGNADGMGDVRKDELYQASAILKVSLKQVKILDHPDLQDGFGKVWNCNLLARIIEEEIQTHAIDLILSFDNYGVSGHCNHCDINRGVRKLMNDNSQNSIEAWELVSTNILRKYSGPIDIWLSILYAMNFSKEQMHCLLNEHPYKSYAAMAQHMSQWVWYRKLFISFSSYTYVNTLRKINI